jgi:toxin-antitoxin system PIN domain toxin
VIAVDTNILVYAHRPDSEFHGPANDAIRSLAEGQELWAIPWPCIHEFLGVVTHSRIFKLPTPVEIAVAQVDAWRQSPSLRIPGEQTAYWDELSKIVIGGKIAGPRIHDARIAAICKSHGVRELWSADRDFSRISGVKTRNPLLTN